MGEAFSAIIDFLSHPMWRVKFRSYLLSLALFLLLTILLGCPPVPAVATPVAEPPLAIWQPSPGTSWQIQLQGVIDTSIDAEMYDIDLFDTPQEVIDELHEANRKVVCYFSAGSWEEWREDADQFPVEVRGEPLEGWPGEYWLDIRHAGTRQVMETRLDLAQEKKCDGVDPDNVDAYTHPTGFPLSADDQLDYNRWLAAEAHERDLAVGLKNDLAQIPQLVTDFEWVINEQCFAYDECELLVPFIEAGKPVFNIEYEGERTAICPRANELDFDTLFKTYDLVDEWFYCRNQSTATVENYLPLVFASVE